ncbi:MAG: N-6 DNA methylase, partial [Verrucomicrobia bacterium]|nr:N-6 DNA methylase [Verrucomicrobiota bacterium]
RDSGDFSQVALPSDAPTYAAFDKKTRALRILDPACGSGSFLLRAFERVCEHYQRRFIAQPKDQKPGRCWTDPATGDVHLTVDLKRRILRDNIYGVDLDAQAVEVTQLSLYLKMLEGEDRATLKRQRELFAGNDALLPPLEDNIKCGNSLIASDFSLVPEDLVRVHAFDWDVQFADIMKAGGFDAVIGNPPWGVEFREEEKRYFDSHFHLNVGKYESYVFFVERASTLCRKDGIFGMIIPSFWISRSQMAAFRGYLLNELSPQTFVVMPENVFSGVKMDSCILTARRGRHMDQVAMVEISAENLANCENALYLPSRLSPVEVTAWRTHPRIAFNPRVTSADLPVINKIEQDRIPLKDVVEITQGLTLYRRSTLTQEFGEKRAEEIVSKRLFHATYKKNKTFKKELLGKDVSKYDVVWNGESWVSYGPWLAHAVDERFFHGPRLVIQKIRNPSLKQRLVAGYLDDNETYSAGVLLNAILKRGEWKLLFILGLLNSILLNYWYRKSILDVSIRVIDLEQLPVVHLDFASPSDRARHDKLVALVDKMLVLVPRLRAEKSESKRKTLQNAVDATDRQIDRLVYDLYGLTDEEIALVEGRE